MGLPPPQFNTPLSPNQINPELPFYPIYGVTQDDKYTPISITENGQLSIGSVTISGPVTVTDIIIKGVDPDNSFVSEDVDVFNLGSGNGWSLRTTLFDAGNNHLAINNDGSINVSVANASIAVTQSTSPWVVSLASTTITGTVGVTQSTSPWLISGTVTANAGTGNFTVAQATGTNLHAVVDSGSIIATQATGTNLHTVIDSGSVTVANATLAVTQSTSPWVISGTVTANIGTTNGLALNSTLTELTIPQGTILGGNTGPLIQGSVLLSPPSATVGTLYTVGQISPIPMSTSGAVFTIPTDPMTGRQAWVDEFSALRANPIARLAGVPFFGTTKDTNFWAETDTGTGSVTQSGGEIVLATGATANSTAQYQTVRIARWVTGNENTFRTSLRVGDTGTANNTRNWGAFTATDGFYFQLTGTTLNVVSLFNSIATAVPQANWNGPGASTFTLDTNFHIWEIKYTYADVHFYIDHKLVHTLRPATAYLTQTLNLNVTLQNINSGGSTLNTSMYVGVAFISRTGLLNTESQYFHGTTAATTTLKYSAGRLHKIILANYASGVSTITIYDNISAASPVISILGSATGTSAIPTSIAYDCPFNTGLTIVSTGTWDFTVVYE